ncbi:MAG: hypothetical protein ACRD5D_04140 [Candidatus Polarisedimenticolia bacterium]
MPRVRTGLTAGAFIAAGAVKLVGLPILIWSLTTRAAFLAADPPDPSLQPARLARSAGFLVEHLHVFMAFWVLLGLFMVVAGAALLRRRVWARVGLEIVCWFGLLEATSVAVFIQAVRRMLLRSAVAGADTLAAALVPRHRVGLALLGVYVVLLILLKRSQGDGRNGETEGQSQGTLR